MNATRLIILASVSFLIALGVTMLWSAGMWQGDAWFHQQLHWIGWGVLAGVVAGCVGHRPLARFQLPWILYGLSIMLLGLVLVPGLAPMVNGARRWLWGMQPSEVAKPSLILAMAFYCSRHFSEMGGMAEGFVRPGLVALPVVVLTFFEPDWGTAILLAMVAGMLMAIAGTPWRRLTLGASGGVVLFLAALHGDPVRIGRFLAFLDPERWKDSYAWQPWLGLLSLGRGGWLGVGLGNGILKLGYVPEQHTDSILTLVGEETGFAGTSLVVVAFMTLVACGLVVAWRAPDPFSQFLAGGITFLIGLQAIMNVGVAVSVLPNKGIPLPFVSYGGSSLITMMACVGLLLGIEARTSASLTRAPGTGHDVRRIEPGDLTSEQELTAQENLGKVMGGAVWP
jgi:cell division protein FtsW